MSRRARLLALLAVVALSLGAGCAGLFGGDAGDTVTPADVPQPEPSLAPGVRESGVVDASRLAAANEGLLGNTSYRFERTVTVTDGTDRFRLERRQHLAADGRAIERLRARGAEPVGSSVRNWTRWREGNTVYARTVLADGNRITNRLAAAGVSSFAVGRDLPRRVLNRASFGVAATEGGRVVLRSTGPFSLDGPGTSVLADPPRNASARLVVTERGLVRNLTVEYTADVGDRDVRVRITQQVTGLGTTTVRRPGWVPAG